MRLGDREEYEVYLSSKFDSHYNFNHAKDFENDINSNLTYGSGIGVFVRLQKVIVKGVNIDRFLVNLEGGPGSNTGEGEDPVIGACTQYDRASVGGDGVLTRIYTFGEEGAYYPFCVGRMGVWHVSLKAWG